MSITAEKKQRYMVLILILCAFMCIYIKTRLGFDIDEQYCFSMMLRFSKGDKYLIDLFDPFQFSAWLTTPLFLLAKNINPQDPVLAYRWISVCVLAIASIRIYYWAEKESHDKYVAVLSALCFVCMLPKSILSLEHSNLMNIFLTYLMLDMYDYFKYGKWHVIRVSIEFIVASMSYPTMVFLYVPIIYIMLFHKNKKEACIFTLICIAVLTVFLIPIITAKGYSGLKSAVDMVLMDGSHQFSLMNRISYLGEDCLKLVKYLAADAVIFLVIFSFFKLTRKDEMQSDSSIVYGILFASPFIVSIIQVIFSKASPNAGYTRYLVVTLIALIYSSKNKLVPIRSTLLFFMIAFIVAYLSTNNGLNETSGFCIITVLLLPSILKNSYASKMDHSLLTTVFISQILYFALTYRTTGIMPKSVFSFDLIPSNTLSGIYVEENEEKFFSEIKNVKAELVTDSVMQAGGIYTHIIYWMRELWHHLQSAPRILISFGIHIFSNPVRKNLTLLLN